MKSSLIMVVVASLMFAQHWDKALPGYSYSFPRDFFEHPTYKTEWWYYTGNVRAKDGHRFGYELTFFRVANPLPTAVANASTPVWRPDELYLAHFAVSDLDGHEFYHSERVNRAGPSLAGASFAAGAYWNGNWKGSLRSLQAITDRAGLALELTALKPAVINGQNGVSQKGPGEGNASHYITFTRLETHGQLSWDSRAWDVTGTSWMDHEFFTPAEQSDLEGWDWFSIQLDNNQELMLYRLRRKDGQADPYSSGTFVDARGTGHYLSASQFSVTPKGTHHWGAYPIDWEIRVPSVGLVLQESTKLPSQELFTPDSWTPSYWEGAVDYEGTEQGKPVQGVGYLEMTGYGKDVWLGAR